MKPPCDLLHWRFLLAIVLVLGAAVLEGAPVLAQSGTAMSSATSSDDAPSTDQQIVVTVNIDMSGVNAPDHKLGSFTGTLDWNPGVLAYSSDSGILAGFAGLVNSTTATAGHITFNGASAMGAAGNVVVLAMTFDVVGAGTSPLDLEYSVMAATGTFANLLPILTVTDSQVVVGSAAYTATPEPTPVASLTATEAPTRTEAPAASLTPTATKAPAPTDTPAATTATLTLSPTPEATVAPAPTGVPTAAPAVTPAPRYWTYPALLVRQAAQRPLPFTRVIGWECLSGLSACCNQTPVAPHLSPRRAPFCQR